MKGFLYFFFCCSPFFLIAQPCDFTIKGKIQDEHSNELLEFATVLIEGTDYSAITDINGDFIIKDVCAGTYHFDISHIGCENERIYIDLKSDTSILIKLHHHAELLQEILVEGQSADRSQTGTRKTLDSEAIEENAGNNLATLTKNITGVTMLNNGSNISKPIIHGLTGNRVAILNNGELQAGQQWGNDHAPEIDPFSADKITVIKGAEGVRYGGNALGGIILIEPGPIKEDPHLHGLAQYVFNSNGRGHSANVSLQKGKDWLHWRVKAGVTKSGDRKTPNYFLRNTGNENAHFSTQLTHQSDRWSHEAYYSFFRTELGILRGAHVGNLTDLEIAINSDTPLFTVPDFSYALEAPRQLVHHHLWKGKSQYFFGEDNFLAFSYAGQFNQRKEFDVRRSGRSDIPALSLNLLAHHFQFLYHSGNDDGWHWESGFQWRYNENDNVAGTGIFPLIPDYALYNPAVFFNIKKNGPKLSFDLGGRYDYKYLSVKRFTNTVPSVYETPKHQFNNFTFLAGVGYQPTKHLSSRLQAGVVKRAPEINELYSAGLHQGVASIEEGNENLIPETSTKFLWTSNFDIKQKLFFETSLYFNPIQDFIYLEPQSVFRLTIRGAFPVFLYKQASVNLWGFDLLNKWEINNNLNWVNKFAWVRGEIKDSKTPLIDIPAADLESSLNYDFKKIGKLENCSATISGNYIFQQERFEENQYFLNPPPGYLLLNASISTAIPLGNNRLQITLKANNLLDTEYRSFLNRLRYFADEEGVNFNLNLRYKF